MPTQPQLHFVHSSFSPAEVDPLKTEKDNAFTCSDSNSQDAIFYVHPHLFQSHDSKKGRGLQVSAPIPAGTVLVVDPPYAIMPISQPTSKDGIICSNIMCCRLVAPDAEKVQCPQSCIQDVLWCSESCRATDQPRHDFECSWLKQDAATVRMEEGEHDFSVLWLVLRLIAARNLEIYSFPRHSQQNHMDERFQRGWDSIATCRANSQLWPQTKLQRWKALVERYLSEPSLVPGLPNLEETVKLICQVETNVFQLHPRAVATVPFPESPAERGELYGLAIYPVATIGNHSCYPNITHKPDSRGRMVFTTLRELATGEECCYTYFDLSKHVDLTDRHAQTVRDYCFCCTCERCILEGNQ